MSKLFGGFLILALVGVTELFLNRSANSGLLTLVGLAFFIGWVVSQGDNFNFWTGLVLASLLFSILFLGFPWGALTILLVGTGLRLLDKKLIKVKTESRLLINGNILLLAMNIVFWSLAKLTNIYVAPVMVLLGSNLIFSAIFLLFFCCKILNAKLFHKPIF